MTSPIVAQVCHLPAAVGRSAVKPGHEVAVDEGQSLSAAAGSAISIAARVEVGRSVEVGEVAKTFPGGTNNKKRNKQHTIYPLYICIYVYKTAFLYPIVSRVKCVSVCEFSNQYQDSRKGKAMTQPFSSTRDMLQQVAFAKLNRDGTEEDMAKGMLTSIVDDTIKNVAKTSERLSTGMANTLVQLNELGYDKDSDVAKSLVSTNMQLQATLIELAKAGVNVVNR